MNWLFWKEYRQNRVIVIALLLMLVAPYLFGLYGMCYQWHRFGIEAVHWQQILFGASYIGLAISQAALAVIGGNVIAGERADRSAEFQVYLPLTREKILAGKLLLVLAIAAAIWLINPFVMWSTFASANQGNVERSEFLFVMFIIATTGVAFFCGAWFFSTFLRSPTFSVFAGLLTPLIIWGLVMFGNYLSQGADQWKPGTELVLQICYVCISLAVALPSFGIGTWLFLRRVEP